MEKGKRAKRRALAALVAATLAVLTSLGLLPAEVVNAANQAASVLLGDVQFE